MYKRQSPPQNWIVPCNREKGFQSVPGEDGICRPRSCKPYDQSVKASDFDVDSMLSYGMDPRNAGEVGNLFGLPKIGNYGDDFDALSESFDATPEPSATGTPPDTLSNSEPEKSE